MCTRVLVTENRQNGSPGSSAVLFLLHRLQLRRIQPQRAHNRRSDLPSFYLGGERRCLQGWIRYHKHHVPIIVGKASVLGDLGFMPGVDHAHVGCHGNVGRARIDSRIVEDQIEEDQIEEDQIERRARQHPALPGQTLIGP